MIYHAWQSLSYHHLRLRIHTVLTHVLGPDFVGFPRRTAREGWGRLGRGLQIRSGHPFRFIFKLDIGNLGTHYYDEPYDEPGPKNRF